jgi:uncharacterized delta-60 repeat protein
MFRGSDQSGSATKQGIRAFHHLGGPHGAGKVTGELWVHRWCGLACAVLAIVGLEGAVPSQAGAVPGDLDGKFSTDGLVTYPTSSDPADPNVVDLAGDRSGVVALTSCSCDQFQLIRYSADGVIDTSFGSGGVARSSFSSEVTATAVTIAPDGRIVVVGVLRPPGDGYPRHLAIASFNPDGSPDPTFGDGGELVDPEPDAEYGASDVVVQPDGELLVAGYGALVRYLPDGERDPSFGTDGEAPPPPGEFRGYGELALLADGRILATGSVGDPVYGQAAVARLLDDGSPDPSFGGDGVSRGGLRSASYGSSFSGLVATPEGGAAAIGYTRLEPVSRGASRAFVQRFQPDGDRDRGFGAPRYFGVEFGGVGLDPGGGVLVAADYKHQIPALNLYRFNPDGTRDEDFTGVARFEAGYSDVEALALDGSGAAYVGGNTVVSSARDPELAFARFKLTPGRPADADADGVADKKDRCPTAFGPTSACPAYAREINFRYVRTSARTGAFRGFVHSEFYACSDPWMIRFEVAVLKQRPGRDDLIATRRYDDDGFRVAAPAGRGTYYARVRRDFAEEIGTCAGARSRGISIRVGH